MWWHWLVYGLSKLCLLASCYVLSWIFSRLLQRFLSERLKGFGVQGSSLQAIIFFFCAYALMPINIFTSVDDRATIQLWCFSGLLLSSFFFIDQWLKHFVLNRLRERFNFSTSNLQLIALLYRTLLGLLMGMMLLDAWGVPIAPLLASLGIGSLAVALALQPSLANLFSGLYLLLEKPMHVGDEVLLEQGLEGKIKKIGWRNTEIELVNGNVLTLPNTRLADSLLQNFSKPNAKYMLSLNVGFSYDADLEKIEEQLLESIRALAAQKNLPLKLDTLVLRYTQFSPSSIDAKIIVEVPDRSVLVGLRHQLIKHLHQTCKAHGIELPYPQQVVHHKGVLGDRTTQFVASS